MGIEMKVGIIIISNRPEKLKRFLESTMLIESIRHKIKIGVLLQNPFTGNEDFLKLADEVKLIENKGVPVPFAYYRKRAMELV